MPQLPYSKYSSDELWKHCVMSDRVAFKHLFENEFSKLLAYGLKVSRNKYDVKDAIQDVFSDLWDKRTEREHINLVSIYLLRAVKFRLLRINVTNKVIDIDSLKEEWKIAPNESSRSELDDHVSEVLKKLPKNQQEILHLKYHQGLSNTQIARLMGMQYQSVSNSLHRIIKRCRLHFFDKIS